MFKGKGKSNTGNVGRIFFKNFTISASITGVEEEVIRRFGVILSCLGSGHKIDADIFEDYCYETTKLFVNKYPWRNLTPSVHKVLIHGAEIIRSSDLPIGTESSQFFASETILRWMHLSK